MTPKRATATGILALAVFAVADEPPRPIAPSTVARVRGGLLVGDVRQSGLFRYEDGRWSVQVAGSTRQRTPLHAVSALTVDRDGTVFAADRATSEVYRIEPGKPPVPLSGGAFEIPTGLALDSARRLLVCDLRLGLVARLPRDGGRPETLAHVAAPRGVAVDGDGAIVVLTMGPDQMVRVSPDGSAVPWVRGTPFRFPLALARDHDRRRWLVSDGYARTVWAVSDEGAVSAWLTGEPLVRPSGLWVDNDGAILIADPAAGRIFRATGPDSVRPWPASP